MEGAILSSWDHIMGPQIEKFWLVNIGVNNKLSEISNDILVSFNISKHFKDDPNSDISNLSDMKICSIMCGQLLLGEVDTCRPFEEWASRFYMSEYKIIIAVIFRVKTWISCVSSGKKTKEACLCFGTIFNREALSFSLDNQTVIDLNLRKGVNIMQNSKIPFDSIMKNVSDIVEDISELLTSLYESNISYLQRHHHPSLQDFMSSDLIGRAIVSHLQTSGCTVVIGGSEFTIHQVIRVLSSFNSTKESRCSFLLPPTVSKSYIQGIYIQAVIKDSHKKGDYLLEKASCEQFSLTVVDIDLGKVWQTIPSKVASRESSKRNSSTIVTQSGSLIPQLLKDLSFIKESGGDSGSLIQNFLIYLMAKSASVIKVIEQSRLCETFLTTKELMTMFGIQDIVDMQIIFGCAERLKPGFRS